MRDHDITELKTFLELLDLKNVRSVLIPSPSWQETDLVKSLYPNVEIKTVPPIHEGGWNFDDPCPYQVDLVIASNIFMCASKPLKWIVNASLGCRYLVVLDHIQAYRGGSEGETSPSTGDVMRYTFIDDCDPHEDAVGKFEGAFNLVTVPTLQEYSVFSYPSFCGVEGYEKTKMFVACFKGSLI